MKVIKSPDRFSLSVDLFLAGTIEQGKAINWQADIEQYLVDTPGILLNPRRDNWDSTWVQSINNNNFNHQVTWEITGLEYSRNIFFNFVKDSLSPISLLELGFVCGRNNYDNVIVCCPKEFWRRGNIEVMCDQFVCELFEDYEQSKERLKEILV